MWWVGCCGQERKAFKSTEEPTPEKYEFIQAVIGPFKTKRAALWCEKYGFNNPHAQDVSSIEKLAKHDQDVQKLSKSLRKYSEEGY